jgi:hypothetical protein
MKKVRLSEGTLRDLHALRTQWKALIGLSISMIALYTLSMHVAPGWWTYGLSVFALVVVLLTAVCRLNDLTPLQTGFRWNTRRMGFLLCALSAVTLIVVPLGSRMVFPSWSEVFLRWGVALAWLTTPNMVPWWNWAWGLPYTTKESDV